MRISNFVIDNATATSTDNFKEVAQVLYITNGNGLGATAQVPACRFLNVRPNSVTKKVAVASQTNQVTTLTPVGTTNGVTYQIRISQLDPVTENYYIATYTVSTPSVGTVSPTTIGDQFKAFINADPNIHISTNGSAATTILTAEAGYATFQVFITNVGLGLTQATSVAGIYKFGETPYLDLLKCGLTTSDFIGSTAGYTKYSWVADIDMGETNNNTTRQPTKFNLFVNQDNAAGTQSTDLITAIDVIWAQAAFITGTVKLL